jgi:hypothetical protein
MIAPASSQGTRASGTTPLARIACSMATAWA